MPARNKRRRFNTGHTNNSRGGGRKFSGTYIDPAKFINKAIMGAEQVNPEILHRFSDFAFSPELQGNITARKYETPTPIQDGAIAPALEGKDVIGLANTGTGKTAAFILPIIERLHAAGGRGSALIIAPTRELATQINDEFNAFAKGLRLYSALCVGGTSMYRQISALQRRPQLIIGTPGRLKDLNQQGVLKLAATHTLVLDEADRMLDMGFINDIRHLIQQLPEQRQTLFFSATTTPQIDRLTWEFLKDPVTVSVRQGNTSQNVEQNVIHASSKEEKIQILSEMLQKPEFEKVLVFGETKYGVQKLADKLDQQGIRAQAIHGNKSQPQRQRALDAFKGSRVRVLVATDVAARGLDINNVSHVINFDTPNTYDDYIHRIGRTGRAGNKGHALTFVSR